MLAKSLSVSSITSAGPSAMVRLPPPLSEHPPVRDAPIIPRQFAHLTTLTRASPVLGVLLRVPRPQENAFTEDPSAGICLEPNDVPTRVAFSHERGTPAERLRENGCRQTGRFPREKSPEIENIGTGNYLSKTNMDTPWNRCFSIYIFVRNRLNVSATALAPRRRVCH